MSLHATTVPAQQPPVPLHHPALPYRQFGEPTASSDRPGALVGNTPVMRIAEPFTPAGHGFWAKLEGFNPGGMKDRPALHMVERAKARGDLAPGARIVESTSGSLGLGLALAGIVHDHPVTLVTDPGLEPILTQMLAAYGARVDMVTEPHPSGGWQQARRDRVQSLLAADPTAWCPDQYTNPDNVSAYQRLALELLTSSGTSTSSSARSAPGATRRGSAALCGSSCPTSSSWASTPSDRPSSANPRTSGSCAVSARASTRAMSTTRRSPRCIGSPPRNRYGRAGPWHRRTTPPAAGASERSHR